jgi:cellulose synthase/poly-beta-1,6-N-acetylglucosamine synthase-like glycosyltransferase
VIGTSVVVPAMNAGDTIGECLESLLVQTTPREQYEVIVVDDGSSDETRDVAVRYQVSIMAQPHDGPAAARNRGAAAAKGEIVLFTDADCVPETDWIIEMLRPFEDPQVSGVKGAYRTQQVAVLPRFVQYEYEERYQRMAKLRWIDFIDTYSAGYRREVFLATGGFDTRYPDASVEDQELSFRLAEHGHKLVFNPRAIVYHQHPETLKAYFGRKFSIGYWKVMVLRRYPGKALRDSHTPQTLKMQMLLSLMLLPLVPLALVNVFFGQMMALTILIGLISIGPFTVRALRKDVLVGLLSPFFLFVRALALGLGMVKGGWDLAIRRKAAEPNA